MLGVDLFTWPWPSYVLPLPQGLLHFVTQVNTAVHTAVRWYIGTLQPHHCLPFSVARTTLAANALLPLSAGYVTAVYIRSATVQGVSRLCCVSS